LIERGLHIYERKKKRESRRQIHNTVKSIAKVKQHISWSCHTAAVLCSQRSSLFARFWPLCRALSSVKLWLFRLLFGPPVQEETCTIQPQDTHNQFEQTLCKLGRLHSFYFPRNNSCRYSSSLNLSLSLSLIFTNLLLPALFFLLFPCFSLLLFHELFLGQIGLASALPLERN